MAIAIDASSPALVRVASGTATTGAFTAPTDSILVACFSVANLGTATDAVSDSGGLTWATAIAKAGDGTRYYSRISWARTTSSASRTVAVAPGTTADNRILKVYVLTGCNLTAPVGNTGSTNTTVSATISQSVTSTVIGSIAIGLYNDGNGGAIPTAASGITVDASNNQAETTATLHQNALSTSVGETMTINTTAPSSASLTLAVAEFVPPVVASGPAETSLMVNQQAIERASFW